MFDPSASERALIIHQSSFFAAGTDQQQGSADLIEEPAATLP